MARRLRFTAPVEATGPAVPPELLGPPVVEDWVSPAERPPAYWSNGPDLSWYQIVARRRQREAQLAWADERGLSAEDGRRVFSLHGAPRFRDYRAYEAAMTKRRPEGTRYRPEVAAAVDAMRRDV